MNDRAKREVIEFEAHRCVSRYLSEVLDGKKTPLIYLTCGVGQHQWGRPRLEGEYEYYYAKDKEVIVFEGIVDAYREISLGEQ